MLNSELFSKRTGRTYLYNIMPIGNIPSVIRHGILSYDSVSEVQHLSVAMNEVQARRDAVIIPRVNKILHSYANLYFANNNPMMYKRRDQAESLCILVITCKILDLPGVIVTDRNAASNFVNFMDPAKGLIIIDFDKVFARFWIHPDDRYATQEHRHIKCAEVLVPDAVPYSYILGAYVVGGESKQKMEANGFDKKIYVCSEKFYRKEVP